MDNGYLFVLASGPTAIGAAPSLKALSYTLKLQKSYWVDISQNTHEISTKGGWDVTYWDLISRIKERLA